MKNLSIDMKIYHFIWLLFFFSLSTHAQNGTIKGTISNAVNNDPIAFATILVEGTDKGTTTDLNPIILA